MRPAQRRRRKSGKRFSLKWLVFLVLGLLLLFIFTSLGARQFKSGSKLGMAIATPAGDIIVANFDTRAGEITSLVIPGTTQLTAARQLGTWKAKSLWQLGQNEGLGGKLIQETVVKDFHFPITAWSDKGGMGFVTGEPLAIIKSMIMPHKGSLTLGDRLKLGIFSFNVKSSQRSSINLADTGMLKKTRLVDGEEGYILTNSTPQDILTIFSANLAEGVSLRAVVKDATDTPGLAQELGRTIEVLGIKVASVVNETPQDIDCLVLAKNEEIGAEVARVFSCRKGQGAPEGNFDLELSLGKGFSKRY